MFEKEIVVDGRGHMLGRLASVVAKELLAGQSVTVVRCDEINQSGSLFRNKLKFLQYLRKRTNTNPTHGPFHFRAPSAIFRKTVRGMLPRKQKRGEIAMALLKVFDGVPQPYNVRKRTTVPDALRVANFTKGREYCTLGDLASHIGWKRQDLVKSLEEKRKQRAGDWYEKKQAKEDKRAEVRKNLAKGPLKSAFASLESLGY